MNRNHKTARRRRQIRMQRNDALEFIGGICLILLSIGIMWGGIAAGVFG